MLVDKNLSKKIDDLIYKTSLKDGNAFEELYRLLDKSVFAYALSILNNYEDAKDVLQDTFINIYTSSGNYKSKGKPLAYVLTITKNLCLLRIRDKRKYEEIDEKDLNSFVYEDNSLSITDKDFVYLCLSKLDKQERQIIMLHVVSGLKHKEIARLLDLPLGTVLSKYNRAMKKLKKIGGQDA